MSVIDLTASSRQKLINAWCCFFSHTQTSPRPTLEVTAKFLYELCPSPDKVSSRWQPLLAPLYGRLSLCPVFFTHVKGDHWVCLQDAVVMTYPDEGLSEAAAAAVVLVYEASQVSLVRLPRHLVDGLVGQGRTTQAVGEPAAKDDEGRCELRSKPRVVCPEHLSELMRADNAWSALLSSEQKCLVLDYLCRLLGDRRLLEDLQLLPLADGSFCACSDHEVLVCRDQQDLSLLPGLRNRLCFVTQPEGLLGRLQGLAESGKRDPESC